MPQDSAPPPAPPPTTPPPEPDGEHALALVIEKSSPAETVARRADGNPATVDRTVPMRHLSPDPGPVRPGPPEPGPAGDSPRIPDALNAPVSVVQEPREEDLWSLPAGPGWRVEGTSVIGQLHIREKRERDDAAKVINEGSWTFIAVADGAGSKKLSRFGAGEAVEFASRTVHERLGSVDPFQFSDGDLAKLLQEAFSLAFGAARSAVVSLATRLEASPSEFACTLILLAHHATDSTDLVAAAQVGDGAVVGIYRTDGALDSGTPPSVEFVVAPESGEYGAQTFFLTGADGSDRALRSLRVWRLSRNAGARSRHLEGLLVMTDGVLDCVYPPAAILEKAARNWISVALAPAASCSVAEDLAQWLSAWEVPGSQDDRTLMMLVRAAGAVVDS